MEQLAEQAERLRWLIAGMIRGVLRSNREPTDRASTTSSDQPGSRISPTTTRAGGCRPAATEVNPDSEGIGHPDYRPPGWSKTVAECCRDANLMRDLLDPETRERASPTDVRS